MKSLLLTFALLVGLSGAAAAQKKDRHAELPGTNELSAVQVDEVTREMCNALRLNEAQYIRLRTVNRIKLARLEEISWQYKDDALAQQTHIGELEAQYEAECSRILSPSQLSLLQNEQPHDVITLPTDASEGGLG